MTDEVASKKMISKSSRFPSIALDYALKVVEEARKFGKDITDSHIAGDKSIKSGAFVRKKASIGYYGLIAGRGDKLQITELAEKIIYPNSDEEKTEALKRAFLGPPLFNRLFSTLEKGVGIKLDLIGNIVVREYGIQPSAKDEFLTTFVKSGIFAHLLKYKDENRTEIILVKSEDAKPNEKASSEFLDPFAMFYPPQTKETANKAEFQTVGITLSNGQGKIIVPKELTELDAQKLKAQINILADIFTEEK